MTKVLATLNSADSNLLLVDIEGSKVYQPLRDNSKLSQLSFGAVAIHRDRIFVATKDEIYEFNPDFESVGSYRNPYLGICEAMTVHEHHLFVASADFDSVLAFNLRKNAFDMAFMLQTDGQGMSMKQFDPAGDDGPLPMNKFHLHSIHCEKGGMYLSGLRSKGLMLYNGKRAGISATLPSDARDVRPFLDGIVMNDNNGGALRYVARDGNAECAFKLAGEGHGLCVVDDARVAAGSSPATITLYDFVQQKQLGSLQLSETANSAIRSLVHWPFY